MWIQLKVQSICSFTKTADNAQCQLYPTVHMCTNVKLKTKVIFFSDIFYPSKECTLLSPNVWQCCIQVHLGYTVKICQQWMKKQTTGSRYQPSTQTNKENLKLKNPCTAVFVFDNLGAQTLLEKVEQ